MKNLLFIIVFTVLGSNILLAQNAKKENSEVPLVSSIQRNNLTNTKRGLLVYDTDNKHFWLYQNDGWKQLDGQQLADVSITNPSTKPYSYLGFTNNGSAGNYAGEYEDCGSGKSSTQVASVTKPLLTFLARSLFAYRW